MSAVACALVTVQLIPLKKLISFLKHYLLALSIGMIIVLAVAYWFFWHLKPFTQNAFVFANTRPVSPLTEGFITEIHVRNNQFVKKGDPLFTIFQPPYRLKVSELENDIRSKEAELKSLHAKIRSAEAEIRRRKAELANNRYLSDRANYMYGSEAVSQAYAEERLRAKQISEAQVESAEHTLSALRHDCDSIMAQIALRNDQLALAKIWSELTVVRALSDGYVTNMTITPGGYYKRGEVLFSFIDSEVWWVQANFKENELSEIRPGCRARIWLWQYPGHEYEGVVEAVGWGAERREMSRETGMPVVRKENEWFLLPQRFPVQIRILHPDKKLALHFGGSAYAEIDVPSRPVRQFFWELFLWTFQ